MPYPTNNPALQREMMQLDQEYAQRKANIMQNFYNQSQQNNNWLGNQNTSAPAQTPTQNVNWIYVSGIDGAKNQIVQPGQTAWMMDNNSPYIYVKSVDNVGSCDFHTFNITEVTEAVNNQQTQPQIDTSQYVQRGEFDELKAQIEQLTTTQKKQLVKANKGVEDNA